MKPILTDEEIKEAIRLGSIEWLRSIGAIKAAKNEEKEKTTNNNIKDHPTISFVAQLSAQKGYEKLMPRCVKLADRVNELEEQLKLYNNEWADLALDILKLPNNGWHEEWRTCPCILCAYRKAIAEKQEKVEKKLKEQV